MSIDRFIARFLPVIGAALFVIGLGYLIYTSVWLTIPYGLKIGVGLFASALLIGTGYSLQDRLKYYADVVIGSGILLFYGTLVYASRTTPLATAFFPEHVSLAVSFAFTAATAYFALVRRSKEILVLSMLGAYCTPFVIGQEDTWRYAISYNGYLAYFFAVNLAVFAVSRKMWIGDIVPLNGLGLLVGAAMLRALVDPASEGDAVMSAVLCALIVCTYVVAMVASNREFPERYKQFVPFAYLAPFLWFAVNLENLALPASVEAILYALVGVVYLAGWYFVRLEDEQAVGKAFLYTGGIASLVLGGVGYFSENFLYAGMLLAAFSLALGGLACVKPVKERVTAYLALGLLGVVVAGFAHDTLGDSRELTLMVSLVPLLGAWIVYARSDAAQTEIREALKTVGTLAIGLFAIVGMSWVVRFDIPFWFLFGTLPAVVTLAYAYVRRETLSMPLVKKSSAIATALLVVAYFGTFFTLVGRIYPFPEYVGFWNEAFLTGAFAALGFFLSLGVHRSLMARDPELKPPFALVMLAYAALLLVVNHQLLALFNSLGMPSDGPTRGLRAVVTTLWWTAVAGWMVFAGVRGSTEYRPEKLLGVALFGFTLLKILFYDLASVPTQMKVVVLMIVGGALMLFSYYLGQKGYLRFDDEDAPKNAPSAPAATPIASEAPVETPTDAPDASETPKQTV